MDLGSRITAWRKQRDLTQVELAERAGVSPSAICQWESPKYKAAPSQASLEAIVAALGLTMERFYGRVPRARAA